MRRGTIGGVALAAVLALGACGGGGTTAKSPTSTTQPEFDNASWDKAGPEPSTSAKMVCEREARDDIAASLGVKAARVTKPAWVRADHLLSCSYVYPRGKIVLTVKELSTGRETTAYFDSLLRKYRRTQKLNGLGQGAWILANGDVVVRKDYKVLLVDVTGIPADFAPTMGRSDVALNVAAVIMSCWVGA